MKKKVRSESEKVKAVHQLESGEDTAVVARDYNISGATLHNLEVQVQWNGGQSD